MNFKEQYKHPKWQQRRLRVLEAHNFTCQECGEKDMELHVHHTYYTQGAMIWDYPLNDLMSLCRGCHEKTHEIDNKIKKHIAVLSLKEKKDLLKHIKKTINAGQLEKAICQPETYYEVEYGSMADMLAKLMGDDA